MPQAFDCWDVLRAPHAVLCLLLWISLPFQNDPADRCSGEWVGEGYPPRCREAPLVPCSLCWGSPHPGCSPLAGVSVRARSVLYAYRMLFQSLPPGPYPQCPSVCPCSWASGRQSGKRSNVPPPPPHSLREQRPLSTQHEVLFLQFLDRLRDAYELGQLPELLALHLECTQRNPRTHNVHTTCRT